MKRYVPCRCTDTPLRSLTRYFQAFNQAIQNGGALVAMENNDLQEIFDRNPQSDFLG
jgi:hypothetical protein